MPESKRRTRKSRKEIPRGDIGDLRPGLRDRLVAEMDALGVPVEGRPAYLAMMTGRAPQATRRWLDPVEPGLPDLESFARLCTRFQVDAQLLLGLTSGPTTGPHDPGPAQANEEGGWVNQLASVMTDLASDCEVFHIEGDEMEPRIRAGTPIIVDTKLSGFAGNGVYLLDYQGQMIVRYVDNVIGRGVVLSCENPRYQTTELRDGEEGARIGLRVIGKVKLTVLFDRI